ncbi:MAG: serine aminopeptidase domain-containing protein [Pseudomonadota bacterium]
MTIKRQPLYFPAGDPTLFGWYHTCDTAQPRDLVAVVCAPMGFEYTHSHRSLRHLCDQLARAGISALRFDYHGTGDSAGGEIEADRLTRWQQDVASAAACAQALSGRQRCCLIGVRIGATLAAMTSPLLEPELLVLWNPVISGRQYIRELKAAATATNDNADTDDNSILESGGFLITADTEAEVRALNLLDKPVAVKRGALVVARDDLSPNTDMQTALGARGIATDQLALPGYADMMARLELNVVPHQAIAGIVRWVKDHSDLSRPAANIEPAAEPASRMHIPSADSATTLTETVCHFGADQHLFGILTHAGAQPQGKPTVLLLNSGSVHHVGPGRLYVTLARHLAQHGFNCFRIDIENIGDSVVRQGEKENHPYPDNAVEDTAAALQYLKTTWNLSSFALTGLCSGAYTAFQAGFKLHDDSSIRHVISINPLTFKWVEGETLLMAQSFKEELWMVNHYKTSARDWRRWLKLLSGKVDYAFIFKMVMEQTVKKMRTALKLLGEILNRKPATPLGQQLAALLGANRSLSFFISSSDPGYHLLTQEGGHYARKLIRTRKIAVTHIDKTDHTFSRRKPRNQLIEGVRQDLSRVFEQP